MGTKRPAVITNGAILLLILSLFVAGLGVANQFGLLGRGLGTRQFVAGRSGNQNFTPPNGFSQNGLPNNQNNQGTTPNFTPNRQYGTGLTTLFRLTQPITIGLDIVLLILSVVAAIALFKSKRWGAILAIVISILLILLTIPGMLRIFSAVVLIENLVRILLAVAVIVLLLLPSARRAYASAKGSVEEQAERIVR
ncbi:MAG: hypothetical protein WAV05_17000 [Anaerolineales bacterium]